MQNPWRCEHELLEGAQVHYCTYLSLTELLGLQWPNASSEMWRGFGHPDEHLFLRINQMFELAFQVHIHELRRVIAALGSEGYDRTCLLLRRVIRWTRFYPGLCALLWTIPPEDYIRFRAQLRPASGEESEAFRIIELLSGMSEDRVYGSARGRIFRYREFLDRPPEKGPEAPKTRLWTPNLSKVAGEPNLYTTFGEVARGWNLPVFYGSSGDERLRGVADLLHEYDEAFTDFRRIRLSTGGSQLAQVLPTETPGLGIKESVIEMAHFFPELWEYKKLHRERG